MTYDIVLIQMIFIELINFAEQNNFNIFLYDIWGKKMDRDVC